MPPKKTWKQFKQPETAHQQLAYLLACQEWFANTKAIGMAVERADVFVWPTQSGGVLRNAYCDTTHRVHVGDSQRSTCASCTREVRASSIRAVPLNPFANISCLLCEECAR